MNAQDSKLEAIKENRFEQFREDIRRKNKGLSAAVVAQIEFGIPAGGYLVEGIHIMQDIHQLLETLKSGNVNNYTMSGVQEITKNAMEAKRGSGPTSAREYNHSSMDNQSVANISMLSKGTVSMKARRMIQIKKLEAELLKMSKRFDMVTDPVYIADIKGRLKQMEAKKLENDKDRAKMEIE